MEQLPQPECIGRGSCDLCIARGVGRVITRHHIYHPAKLYTTKEEREFRNHPFNIEELPWCEHKLKHVEEPPPDKPSRSYMRWFLETKNEIPQMGR